MLTAKVLENNYFSRKGINEGSSLKANKIVGKALASSIFTVHSIFLQVVTVGFDLTLHISLLIRRVYLALNYFPPIPSHLETRQWEQRVNRVSPGQKASFFTSLNLITLRTVLSSPSNSILQLTNHLGRFICLLAQTYVNFSFPLTFIDLLSVFIL